MHWTRRRVLKATGAWAGAAVWGGSALPVSAAETGPDRSTAMSGTIAAKSLSLLNLHTGERRELVFYRGDAYVPAALAALQVLLRDFRNGEQHAIDPKLMDYLYDVAKKIGAEPIFSVISGYRSPQSNEQLRERSDGVARRSLHLEGRAIDVRLAGVDCLRLATHARALSRGGVGYYRKSNFVHLDTGAFRTWNG